MGTNTYKCININTNTDMHPILAAGCVHTLTHLAKNCFEDVFWLVVIIVTLCVIVRAITDTYTPCRNLTITQSGCKPFRGCDAAGSVCTIINHIHLSRDTCTISVSRWRDAGCTNEHTVPSSYQQRVHIDIRERGGRARGGAVRCMCSAVHQTFSR